MPDPPQSDWSLVRPASLNELQRLFPPADEVVTTSGNAESLIQQAHLHAFAGDLPRAAEFLAQARSALDTGTGESLSAAKIRWDLESGRWFLLSRIPTKAAPFFLSALDQARTEELVSFAIEAAVLMSISQPAKNRTVWLKRAMESAEASTTGLGRRWLPCLHFLMGWNMLDSRQFEDALSHFDEALARTPVSSLPEQTLSLRWSRGYALRALKRPAEALEVQRILREELVNAGRVNGHVELEIGECLQAAGKTAEARECFAAAHSVLSQDRFYADNYPTELGRILKLSKNA